MKLKKFLKKKYSKQGNFLVQMSFALYLTVKIAQKIDGFKVFIISIFIQIVFGRLTFLRENVNLPKKFDKNLFSTPPKTQIPVTKVFIF